MEQNIQAFIERVKKSDLSESDKIALIEKLDRATPDIPGFVSTWLSILKISSKLLTLFDIDIGDDF